MDIEQLEDYSVGSTLVVDDTFHEERRLQPAEAYSLVRERTPQAVIGIYGKITAGDEKLLRAIKRNSVCKQLWSNKLSVVTDVNPGEGTVTVVERRGRIFALKTKWFTTSPAIPSGTNLARW